MNKPFEMIIPDRLRVGGQLFNVEYNRDRHNMSNFGQSSNASCKIILQDECTEGELCFQSKCNTFWHEVTHMILDSMGYVDLSSDEKFVSSFGSMLNEVMQSSEKD